MLEDVRCFYLCNFRPRGQGKGDLLTMRCDFWHVSCAEPRKVSLLRRVAKGNTGHEYIQRHTAVLCESKEVSGRAG